MKQFICIVLITVGCLQQGVKGVHYITGEIDSLDENGDGIPEEIVIYITFQNRSGEPVSFYDAECCATITCRDSDTILYETSVSFDASYIVGKDGGIIIPLSGLSHTGAIDITVTIVIEGRGTFQWRKTGYEIGTY